MGQHPNPWTTATKLPRSPTGGDRPTRFSFKNPFFVLKKYNLLRKFVLNLCAHCSVSFIHVLIFVMEVFFPSSTGFFLTLKFILLIFSGQIRKEIYGNTLQVRPWVCVLLLCDADTCQVTFVSMIGGRQFSMLIDLTSKNT